MQAHQHKHTATASVARRWTGGQNGCVADRLNTDILHTKAAHVRRSQPPRPPPPLPPRPGRSTHVDKQSEIQSLNALRFFHCVCVCPAAPAPRRVGKRNQGCFAGRKEADGGPAAAMTRRVCVSVWPELCKRLCTSVRPFTCYMCVYVR